MAHARDPIHASGYIKRDIIGVAHTYYASRTNTSKIRSNESDLFYSGNGPSLA